jgi:hypothetical protein
VTLRLMRASHELALGREHVGEMDEEQECDITTPLTNGGELSGAAPTELDTSAGVGLRDTRGSPATRAETCIRVVMRLHGGLVERNAWRG